MCSKFLSTLATRTSCPHAYWPCFVLDGGKSRFNCPLICCRMLLHQQLPWQRIKHTRKHYFSTQIINSAKSHKSLFWKKKFFSSHPLSFPSPIKRPAMDYTSVGSSEIPSHTYTFSVNIQRGYSHSGFDKTQKIQKCGKRKPATAHIINMSMNADSRGGYTRTVGKPTCLVPHTLIQNLQEEIHKVSLPLF